MELSLKPTIHNRFPLNGILVKGSSVRKWLIEIQRMELRLSGISVYPLPGLTANSIWGCMIVPHYAILDIRLEQNEICQQVSSNFFIASRSELFPKVSIEELEKLFSKSIWLMHPEIGLFEMSETIDFKSLVILPKMSSLKALAPEVASDVPRELKSFQIAPINVDAALKKMEEQFFPKREKMEEQSLNSLEKAKLFFYKKLFKGNASKINIDENSTQKVPVEKIKEFSLLGKFMHALMSPFYPKGGQSYGDHILDDLESLEKRNQKQLDRLLDMLHNDPEEALKYAIPLDETGSFRGQSNGKLEVIKKRSSFSIFEDNSSGKGKGGTVDIGDYYNSLKEQYRKTALELIEKKNFEKAAFVYLKLLKDNRSAAETLEKGGLYKDAAAIYLKFLNDKHKAAQCFVKGNMIANAIDIYKELKEYEKVGDMYTMLNQKKEADIYFEQVAKDHLEMKRHVKASLIYRKKMLLKSSAQNALLMGWHENYDAENCLRHYLSDYAETEELKKELNRFYKEDVNPSNEAKFLSVLKNQDYLKNGIEHDVLEIVYDIVAKRAFETPDIVKDLLYFNRKNEGLLKDTLRFSIGRSKSNK